MKTLRLVLVTSMWLALALPALGGEVIAVGEAAIISGNKASARTQALQNAQRNAVEEGVGALLDSKTLSENMQLLSDKIYSTSQGFVKKYEVLEEGTTPDGTTFRVKIKAVVAQDLLEDRLSALRILQKKTGNRRLMVIYRPTNPHALKRDHGAVTSAQQTLQDSYNAAGFRVFNTEATAKVYKQMDLAGDRPVQDVIGMALDQQADILVAFEDVGGKKDAQGGAFSAAYATLRVSVYDVVTGRQMADAQVEGKKLMLPNAGPYDWEKGLVNASAQAAQEAARQSIDKIASFYKQEEDTGGAYMLVFQGYDDDEKNTILDYLETVPGFQQLNELKNTPLYLEVELFTNEDPSRLRRIIYAGLKEKKLALNTQSATRNRIMFTNPKRIESPPEK